VNGSTRWISFGLFNVQVSEIAKLCLIAYLAGYVVRRRDELLNTWPGFLKPLGVLGIASVLLVIEPDFGATVVLVAASAGMIFLSGVRLSRFMPLIGVLVVMGSVLVFTQPYRLKRVVSYLDPWKDQFDTGYQLTQSLIAFGRGDWAGTGLGNSVQKLFYLPEAHTDFIFAIIAEEFGLLGSLMVLGLFTVLVVTGFVIARRAEKAGMPFAACFSYGITLLIGLQAGINMAVSTGLLPTKGLTLPLVSYGGSSLMITAVCIGVLARVEMERLDREKLASEKTRKPAARGGAVYD
jgi:cell division protein FtsW